MKVPSKEIRNFTVAGHLNAGKTSLCDLMLFKAKKVDRLGKASEKTSVSDFTQEEQAKQSSIYSSALNCKWDGKHFFFMDTPGYGEYLAEQTSAITNSDSALLVVDAVLGPQVGTARAWKTAKNENIPVGFFINGMDKDLADFEQVLSNIQDSYGKNSCVPVNIPGGKGASLKEVIEILKNDKLPAEFSQYKEKLMDIVAESNEELMNRYLSGEALSEEEIMKALRVAMINGSFVPVFCGSVSKDIGIKELMNGIIDLFATPMDKVLKDKDGNKIKLDENGAPLAKVIKTTNDAFLGQLTFIRVYSGTVKADSEVTNTSKSAKEHISILNLINGKNQEKIDEASCGMIVTTVKLKNTTLDNTLSAHGSSEIATVTYPVPVMSYSISTVKSGEEDKMGTFLHKLTACDPTLKLERHLETHEMLLSGMGDQHLGLAIKKLKDEGKIEVHVQSPKIPYRETVTSHGEGHYRHKKQSGGHGQFGEVYLKVDPNPSGYEFKNAVVGGNIPKNFIPAVEKGVLEAMIDGPLAGCHVQNILVTVYDGKYHDVDSSEMAFKIASRGAFRDAVEKAKPILLEPIQNVKIMVPSQYMGDVTGDLNHKRGKILGMESEEGMEVVRAEVPLAELSKYATELRSVTHGNGSFESSFARYEMVPSIVAKGIIEAHKKSIQEENE